jgi:uncharacterized protein YjeT (DUF2065 family)
MSMLHTLAIILGILTVATRLPGVLWPKGFREHSMQLIESNLLTRVLALFALAVGLIIVVTLVKTRPWLEVILLLLALFWLPAGAMMLWNPDLYRRMANKVLLANDLTLRALCGLGVLIGFLLCFLGIFG